MSWGSLGLLDALEKFDPDRQVQFSTYAVTRIRGAILDGLQKMDWARLNDAGNAVIIDHRNGLATLYAHQSRVNVTLGQKVTAGQVVGFVGQTGMSTGVDLGLSAKDYLKYRKNILHILYGK